jgi:aryl carrier-like protein
MTVGLDTVRALPRSLRRAALADLVTAEFRQVLLLPDNEDMPTDVTVFDLGMTSLRLIETRQRLTRLVGGRVEITVLFEHPTVAGLLDHLATTVLADLFAATATTRPDEPAPPPMLDDLLRDLTR